MSDAKPSLSDLRIERKETPPPKPRGWFFAAGAVCLVIVMLAWWFAGARSAIVHTVPARESVQSGGGGSGERTVLNASGYVTARREATVSSKVTGKVVEVLIEEGMKVEKDQVLARLDDTNVRASLDLAEAQLVSSKASLEETRVRLKEAEQELQRQDGLLKSKIATQADFDHAQAAALAYQAKLEQQRADVIVAERNVASFKQQMDDTIIRAPFAGIVTSKNAQPGEMISPISAGGGFTRTGICTIVDMDSLEIEIDVNESYINRVESGQAVEATLDAYPDWKIPSKVIAIIPTADRQKSTVKVRVGFEKLDPRILPDMGVKVGFREGTAAAKNGGSLSRGVVVPKSALQQRGGQDTVGVVLNGRAERHPVTVSNTTGDEVVISSGISVGDRVVVDWPQGLADGGAVREIAK